MKGRGSLCRIILSYDIGDAALKLFTDLFFGKAETVLIIDRYLLIASLNLCP